MILLLVPAVAMLTMIIIIPVLVVTGTSFFRYNLLDMSHMKWNNFANYRAVFTDIEFIRTFGHTLVYACGIVFFQFFIDLGMTLLLNSDSLRGRRLLRSLLFLPWTILSLVVAVTWTLTFQPQYDIFNYLSQLGDYSVSRNPRTAMMGIIMLVVWKQMSLMMITLLSGLQTVSEDLKEAAEIGEAMGIQKLWCTVVSCIMLVVKTIALTSIVSSSQMFVLFFTMTGGGPMRTTTTLLLYIYRIAFSGFSLGKGAVIGVCWLIFLITFSTVYNKVLLTRKVGY